VNDAIRDTSAELEKLLNKLVNYRIFNDHKGHMNLSVTDVQGELLIVSQFTVAADTKKGLRPSFSSAAPPEIAEVLYNEFVEQAGKVCKRVAVGRFGACVANIAPSSADFVAVHPKQ
jgi:D-tyrosyl-tRNA(Tyr) deacylase